MTAGRAARAVDTIHQGFDEYHQLFREITRRTRRRFEEGDWDGIRRETVRRLDLHEKAISDVLGLLEGQLGEELPRRELWARFKEDYAHAILGRDDFELAQTFFNSLTRRLFPHDGVDPVLDFVSADFPLPYHGWEMASARMYAARRADAALLRRVIEDAGFRTPFEDLERDSRLAAARIGERVTEVFGDEEIESLDVLRPVLIRNKAAYLVGRARRDERRLPVVLAILNRGGELLVDAVLTTEDSVSILFSFARWYFHAEIESPREVIGFLHSILPRKHIAELYISLGYNKHGKTEFYRDLMRHIAASEERFEVAPGVPGQVMAVFTLEDYPFVFKVIRDVFPPSKRMTREDVTSRYREVLRHDRVGRLVDFQEFEHVKIPRSRFDEGLLEELLRCAGRTVVTEGDDVIIRHMYFGRKVTPLDIFLRERDGGGEAECAVVDWGNTIKELAAANIFAGDMLLKNFGVTRHGRVVFYDYDELCAVSACRFRRMPEPRGFDQEMSDGAWFTVGEHDIFPEEMRTFMGLGGELLEIFEDRHGELFGVDYWRGIQERQAAGELIDFFPYGAEARLKIDGS